MLLSMLIAAFWVVGCAPEADGGAEPVDQVDALAVAPALPDAAATREEPAAKPAAAVRSALDPVPCTPDVDSALVITEIMADPVANPGGSDTYGEWIEIHNPGLAQVNLNGYVLSEPAPGTNIHTIGADVLVPPGGYVVLCRSNDLLQNGGVACHYMYLNTILNNGGGDTIILKNPQGDVVDQVAYTGTVPSGRSMALRNINMNNATIAIPANPNDPAAWAALNWGASTATFGSGDYGTPGAPNADVFREYSDPECNDDNLCTADRCNGTVCENTWITGCCTTNTDCNDGNVCTNDLCNTITHQCANPAIPNCCTDNAICQDANPCNADYCLDNQCRHSAYNIVPGCCYAPPDVNPFTGVPWVSEAERQLFGDSQCDDKNACTADACNLETNLCTSGTPITGCCNVNEDCEDSNACTYNLCFNNVCSFPKKSASCCVTNADCDDNNPCTRNVCYIGNCRYYFSTTECCNPADPTFCQINADDGNLCTNEVCVQNTVTLRYECQHQLDSTCKLQLPYIETFDTADSFTGVGYTPINLPGSTAATNHWLLASSVGDLGPDKHVLFDWYPTAVLVKSALVSPVVDASSSDLYLPNQFTKQTTVQWRQSYKHSQPGTPITLRVVASATNDFVNGYVLWAATTTGDLPYDLMSARLPAELKFATALRLGFVVDTGANSTIAMEEWEIDDVKIGAGVANDLVKSMVYACPGTAADCRPNVPGEGVLVAEGGPDDPVPDVTMGACGWTRVYLCYNDADASQSMTWNFNGFPGAYLDGAPLDRPAFISQTPTIGLGLGCETNATFVRNVCGAGSTANIYCAIDMKPGCDDQWAGGYTAGLICKDEGDPNKLARSPFESLTKVKVDVLLEDGYIVYAPNGASDPSAVEILAQIKANGRRAQMITNLALITDLTRYDGVFVVLGVYGRYHALTALEASRLKGYMDAGGRVYLEGGEFFFTDSGSQAVTSIHEYFKTTATYDGVAKQDGPIVGANFLAGYSYDLSQNAVFNAWNDRLVNTPGQGGLQVLRNGGLSTFASVVSYDGIFYGGPYRTLASAISFGGLAAQVGGKTTTDLMGQYLNFLENGYPPCTDAIQCEDFDVCTEDTCSGTCQNTPRPGCTPCINDRYALDGSYSCDLNEACDVAAGYCVPIPGERFDIALGSCNKLFGGGLDVPTQASCLVDVLQPGTVQDVQVKVMVEHYYRGDTQINVTSPSGVTVALKDANLADGRSHVYETYDVGVPEAGDLDTVNGGSLAGAWNLVVTDVDPDNFYNGNFEGWHLFATYGMLSCETEPCPTDDLCATYACIDDVCVPTPTDCDDLNPCTIDRCDRTDGSCIHEVIPGCSGECFGHADCATHEVCLACDPDDPTCELRLERTCDPLNDIDPISGETLCRCSPIEGTPYALGVGLPVPIPDGDPAGVTRTLVTTSPGYIKGLKVKVRTDHTSQGDLTAELCRDGVCVTLRAYEGGQATGFFDVYDYDMVTGPGTVDDFDQMPIAGTWTLTVTDIVAGYDGILREFVLYINAAECYADVECDDGNLCTVDVCQNPSTGGTCEHTMITCQPSDDTCTTNQCNPATGTCHAVAQINGTACEDGLYCTEDDSCQAGVCTGGTPRSCEILDGVCQIGVCNEDLRQCVPTMAPDSTPCDDGQLCTEGDFCEAGLCMPGPTLTCACLTPGSRSECAGFEDNNKCNGSDWVCNADRRCELADGPVICPDSGVECVENVCDSFDGLCKLRDALNYWPCDDTAFCTVADYCLSGSCQGGEPRSCADLDTECAMGVCDETDDQCETAAKEDGLSCEADGAGCTIDECLAGFCRQKRDEFNNPVNVSCSLVADDCNDGVCQNVGWGGHVCVKGPLPDGTICTDEPNPCTEDTCQGGWCQHVIVPNCNGPCGGAHMFDAGDDMCGIEDSCENGYLGYPNGGCTPTCLDGNCVVGVPVDNLGVPLDPDAELGLPIDNRLPCAVAYMNVPPTYQYVESLEAKVKLTHGYLADLVVTLIDPQGYEHRIWDHVGGAYDNFDNTFDLSMPVPYPFVDQEQSRVSGVPMCAFKGEQAAGIWRLQICDTGDDNGGVLRDWKFYVRGTDVAATNPGHRCETAIDLGNQDVNPAIIVGNTIEGDDPHTTLCALNAHRETAACGGLYGPDRTYKFELTVPKRVTIKLFQPNRDLVLFLKAADGATCASGFLQCEQSAGWAPGAAPEVIDTQLQPGTYYVGVDTAGFDGARYNYGPYSFELRVQELFDNGEPCVDAVLGPQDLDCLSGHCQNGYCCDSGDCCPGAQWVLGGTEPKAHLIEADGDWQSANAICPESYKVPAICFDTDYSDPSAPINLCQGERWDANCVDNICVTERVDDDSACDFTVEADNCGYALPVVCGDYGPAAPWAQDKPDCPGWCASDTDCDTGAHCDPAIATEIDPSLGWDPILEVPLKWCQPDLPNGAPSNEDSDCLSGHSQNGFCCDSGDCCPTDDVLGAGACPAAYTEAPSCTDWPTCTGHRYDPVCSNNICYTEMVQDSCACSWEESGQVSDDCGLYIQVVCPSAPSGTCPATGVGEGGWVAVDPPCLTTCETNGQDDDSKCDDIARCDLCDAAKVAAGDCDASELGVRVCMANVPNGYPCDEGTDCANKLDTNAPGGHCANGFCCDSGTCCNQNTDCPTQTPPSGFWAAPSCSDWTTCQGTRTEAVCWNDPSQCDPAMTPEQCAARIYSCGSVAIEDDTACVYDPARPSNECGFFKPVFCNGAADQAPPECATSCWSGNVEDNNFCDLDAHCDPDPGDLAARICLGDLPNDDPCNETSDCISDYCQMSFCCDPTGCCAGCRPASAGLNMGATGVQSTSLGLNLGVYMSVGQPGVNGYRTAIGLDGADMGYIPNAMQPIFCWDGAMNVSETDVDCGGGTCKKCASGRFCQVGSRDCVSGVCNAGVCQ
jgi:subtilisin-like proprotein convertase family protein